MPHPPHRNTPPATPLGYGLPLPQGRWSGRSLGARGGGWALFAWLCAGVVLLPFGALLLQALGAEAAGVWGHLLRTLLPRYAGHTAVLLLLSGLGALAIGVSCAWLTTVCRFPGRRILHTALLLPLGVPPYLAALFYTELLDYAGPLQIALRRLFGWRSAAEYAFPEVRSLGGAAAFFALTLYPYVLLLARQAFLGQGMRYFEAGRSLGGGPWRCFFTLALPLAWPALAIGTLLVMLEVLADFGVADFFAVPTLSVGLHRLWFGQGAQEAGARLAWLTLLFAWGLFAAERRLAHRGRRDGVGRITPPPWQPFVLQGWRAAAACLACTTPVALGFGIPLLAMLHTLLTRHAGPPLAALWPLVLGSLLLSASCATLCLLLGAPLAYALRVHPTAATRMASACASLGYATPGVALAVGILSVFGAFDYALSTLWAASFGTQQPFVLGASLLLLLLGLALRFLAIPRGATQAALEGLTRNMDDAARSLGAGLWRVFRHVHLPAALPALLAGWLLVFVESMKELPITLLLRPFGFDTLAVKVYEFASYESYAEAALPALLIVLAGLGPIILLSHYLEKRGRGLVPSPARARPASQQE